MTEEKWKSATGHAISSIETDQLTKPPENVTCGDVSNVGDSLIDRIDDMLSVQPDADGWFKNLHDIQMLISRDEAAEIKRALAQQQQDAELLSVLKEVLYYDDKHDALPTHIEFKIRKAIARAEQKGGV